MADRSEVSICNQALGWLGGVAINSFDDGTDNAILCEQNYAPLRDSVLEEDIWTFATKRIELQLLSDAEFGYGSAFQLPPDLITVDKAYRDQNMRDRDALDYVVEGSKILVDQATCWLRYVYRLEDVVQFSANFTQAVAYRIATELAIPLTKSRTMQQQMFGLYQERLERARSTDGMQSPAVRTSVQWVTNAR